MPLLVRNFDGWEAYFIEVRINDQPVALQVDTGAAESFILQPPTEPDFTPDVADVELGCDVISFPGRGIGLTVEPIAGLEVVGLLGADYFLAAPTRIDAAKRTVTRLTAPGALEQATANAVPIAFDEVLGHILAPVELDGDAVRLMFDTGAATLRIGVNGNPGDEEILVQDADGNIFSVYRGTATLSTDNLAERVVPVERTPTFPYFEQTVDALGGNLHGLLGLEAFAQEAIVVDGASGTLHIVPSK